MRNARARARASVYSHGNAVHSHFEAKAILRLALARGQGLQEELGNRDISRIAHGCAGHCAPE
eukprot:7832721-Alexandrium_andersonii.AAC.1